MPVQLVGGQRITFEVWVSIHPDELQRAYSVWWEPEYADLRSTSYLAYAINPWGLLGAPVALAVRGSE
ncbi:hypothetical protein [Paenarthrobacter sp. 2TAF44]|uniref:hypothetical protein n=1 Tax=Paenarthrobacter sp. 2TAF44 TaxID=3233018 RepID=UPI003F995350